MQSLLNKGLSRAGSGLRAACGFLELGTAVRCLACGRVIPAGRTGLQCCEACLETLEPRQQGYCPGCGQIYISFEEPPYLCLD
ncbi:MAG: hypothetical protein ACOC43_07810 [Desulfohalobiaceae bacterium]